ncbi:hypothetical protein BVRB_4g083390 [Beta vulgaris subsp. vulgaris]|nr:hypothetical protein BVRB_4g083390 [Beta vulgaris subsp. vulgaris]
MDGFRVMSKAGDGWMDESQSNLVMAHPIQIPPVVIPTDSRSRNSR